MSRIKTRVAVAGGAGFIGSHTVDKLVDRGYDVVIIDNLSTGKLANIERHVNSGKAKFFKGDIRNLNFLIDALHDVNVVFNLAGVKSVPFSLENPDLTMDINVGGTINLLVAALHRSVSKFVFVSSCAVYGNPSSLPVNENCETIPISPYAESKLAAEIFCLGFHERQLLKSVIVRLFNVYGPRQNVNEYCGVITRFVERCKQGKPLMIYGDGHQSRDFIYVEDVANAIVAASERSNAEGQIFNISSGKATSINELARKVLRICNSSGRIEHEKPRAGDIRHSFADISKAQRILEFSPSYALEDGLRILAPQLMGRCR